MLIQARWQDDEPEQESIHHVSVSARTITYCQSKVMSANEHKQNSDLHQSLPESAARDRPILGLRPDLARSGACLLSPGR